MNKYIILALLAGLIFIKRKYIVNEVIKQIREKYNAGFDRSYTDVREMVVHGTGGGGSAAGLLNWILGGERADEYKRGVALFHYLIDRDGTNYNVIDPKKWVYHSSSGTHDKATIGVEMINPSTSNSSAYTPEQYKELAKTFADLRKTFPYLNVITTHNYNGSKYSNYPKECPGKKFSFSQLQAELLKRGISTKITIQGLEVV